MFRRGKKDKKEDKKGKKGKGETPTGGPTPSPAPAASPAVSASAASLAASVGGEEEFDDKRVSLPRRIKPAAKTTLPDPSPSPAAPASTPSTAPPAGRGGADSGLQDLDDLIANLDSKLGPSRPGSTLPTTASTPRQQMPPIEGLSLSDTDDPLAALMSFAGVGTSATPAAAPASRASVAAPAQSAVVARSPSVAPAPRASTTNSGFGAGRVSTATVDESMLDDVLSQLDFSLGGKSAAAPAQPARASVAPKPVVSASSEPVLEDPLAALLALGGVESAVPAQPAQPAFQQQASIASAGPYNPPPLAQASYASPMGGFPMQHQPMHATYSGGAGPVSTEEGGYYGNTTVADDVNQIITDNPDDMRDFPTESVYIDSATQRYVLPQNKLEFEMRHEMMHLRRNPTFYAQVLMNEFRPYYQGTALRIPGQPGMATSEGVFACEDAIRFLMNVQPLHDPIYLNFGMCLAAKEAVEECCPTGSFDYPDSVTKMINYGYLEDEAKDLVGYGGKNVRHMILLAFILCDGDQSRERRNIIFDPRWRMMGVGAGVHNSPFKMMCVANFAISYTPLLDGLKQSPLFRNLVQIGLREEAREMLDAIRSLQAGPTPAKEEDDWRARLRNAALKVSQATGGLMLSDKREDNFVKVVDVFKNLKAVESTNEDETNAKLRQAALLVGKATEQLVVSNANDKQFIRPVDIMKELSAVSNAPVEVDPLRAKLSNAALDAIKSAENLVTTIADPQWGGQ